MTRHLAILEKIGLKTEKMREKIKMKRKIEKESPHASTNNTHCTTVTNSARCLKKHQGLKKAEHATTV